MTIFTLNVLVVYAGIQNIVTTKRKIGLIRVIYSRDDRQR